MEELTLTTPALLFSAVSLILLAYTNRFLSYAQLVRTLKEQHLQHPSKVTRAQIDNLRRRLHLTRTMQILGVTSLFLCVVTMFLLYVGLILLSAYVFGAALLLLIGSLGVSIWEIQISVIPTLREFFGYCLIPSNKGQRMMVARWPPFPQGDTGELSL